MTNTAELRAAFARCNVSKAEAARVLGISRQNLYMKINNQREFRASEISKLSELLNITDIMTIFFTR